MMRLTRRTKNALAALDDMCRDLKMDDRLIMVGLQLEDMMDELYASLKVKDEVVELDTIRLTEDDIEVLD